MQTVRLSPGVRAADIGGEAIPAIPIHVIHPFLSQPRVVPLGAFDNAPFILGNNIERVILAAGDDTIATGGKPGVTRWNVLRPGKALRDPVTSEELGHEVEYLGDARTLVEGAPQKIRITKSAQEILPKDKLVEADDSTTFEYVPHAPEAKIDGRIISAYGGLSDSGRYQTVMINRGSRDGLEPGHVLAVLALALTASTAAAGRWGGRASWLPTALLASVLSVLFVGTLAISVFREEHIRNIPLFWATFNAVFYSVVQIYFGRELTVDFINLYGMFPHRLEPIFRVTGLSIFTFTLLMGLLNCVIFAVLHRFLVRETRSAIIALLGTTCVFFFCYASARPVPQPEHCFQYHPLRMLFPVILVVLAQSFAHKPKRWLPAALGALGAAACLWTTDVGLIVLASGVL